MQRAWWNSWNWWNKSNITYNDTYIVNVSIFQHSIISSSIIIHSRLISQLGYDNSRCYRLLYIWNAKPSFPDLGPSKLGFFRQHFFYWTLNSMIHGSIGFGLYPISSRIEDRRRYQCFADSIHPYSSFFKITMIDSFGLMSWSYDGSI